MVRAALAVSLAATMTCAAAESRVETTIRLKVPSRVAAARSASPPVLILENVELGDAKSVTIEVHGPPHPKSRKRELLGRASTVGPSPARMTLVIPLNDAGARLVAGRREVTLTLRTADIQRRARKLKYERAYFDDEGK